MFEKRTGLTLVHIKSMYPYGRRPAVMRLTIAKFVCDSIIFTQQ